MNKDSDHVFESIWGKVFTIKDKYAPGYFLDSDFERVKEPKSDNNILTWGFKTSVNQIMYNFKNTFRFEPSKKHSDMPLN